MSKEEMAVRARAALDAKTKPPGSLGRLENIAVQLCCIQGTLSPLTEKKRIAIFAASHGICSAGVSPYPASVTVQMVGNFLAGGAAVNALARTVGAEVHVVDVGVEPTCEFEGEHFFARSVAAGTQNFLEGPAMSAAQCEEAMAAGREQVRLAQNDGVKLLGLGEMGIGNTTAAAAVCAALLGLSAAQVTGRGTGADNAMLARKISVVERALMRHRADAAGPLDWLARVGGFELAAICGAVLEARRLGLAVVIDGFIATAGALVALRVDPACKQYCFWSHCSAESGHAVVLEQIGERALLDLGLRLGEGTGAALAFPLLDAAARVMREMATFESAGVANREGTGESREVA